MAHRRQSVRAQRFQAAFFGQPPNAFEQIVSLKRRDRNFVRVPGHSEIGFAVDQHNQQAGVRVAQLFDQFENAAEGIVHHENVDVMLRVRQQLTGFGFRGHHGNLKLRVFRKVFPKFHHGWNRHGGQNVNQSII